MTCSDCRTAMRTVALGEFGVGTPLGEHLAHCDACRHEARAITEGSRILAYEMNSVPPAYSAAQIALAARASMTPRRVAGWRLAAVIVGTALATSVVWAIALDVPARFNRIAATMAPMKTITIPVQCVLPIDAQYKARPYLRSAGSEAWRGSPVERTITVRGTLRELDDVRKAIETADLSCEQDVRARGRKQ